MKIIIENRAKNLDDCSCLNRVSCVINEGKISNNNDCYCYVTVFNDCIVEYVKNKCSDKFIILDLK